MLPLRLVFDTNQIVSAAMKPDGLQQKALRLALTRPARLYVSEDVLFEYDDVLRRPELNVAKGDRLRMLQIIRRNSYVVRPRRRLTVCDDPDDNIFVECADAARADYLVTGNLKHYPPFWKGTKVITARELIGLVAPHML